MESKRVPEIRFSGFDGEWKQVKIGKVVEDYVEKTTVQDQYPVLTSSQTHGIMLQDDYFTNGQVPNKNNIGYFILPRGYFAFRSRSDNGVFKFNRNDLIEKGIISYFYPVFRLSCGNSDFFLNMLNSTIKKEVAIEAEGTGQKVLSLKKFKSINVTLPENKEQEEIGNFFKQLDDTIALNQQELTTLKQTKQGFLQKMFPKEGESVPEIRFPGFTGEWEQRMVLDFSEKTLGGGTPKTSIKEYWDGDIPWIQSSDLQEHQVSGTIAKKRITEAGLNNSATKLVPKNSIAIVTRVGFGKIALMPFNYTTSQDFLSLVNLKVNEWFGVYSLYNKLQKEISNVQGTSIKGITKKELLNMKMYIPISVEEQTNIGNLFKQLDETIALYQHELDTLKQTKKAFLQKMFV